MEFKTADERLQYKNEKLKATIMVRKLRLRAKDPASSPAEVEVCHRKIDELMKTYNLNNYNLRSKANIGEFRVRCKADKAEDIAKIVCAYYNNPIAVMPEEDFHLLFVGKKTIIRKVERICKLVLMTYEDSFSDFEEKLRQDIRIEWLKYRTQDLAAAKVDIIDTWYLGFGTGLQHTIDSYRAARRPKHEVKMPEIIPIEQSTALVPVEEEDPTLEDIVAYSDQVLDRGMDEQHREAEPIKPRTEAERKAGLAQYKGALAQGYHMARLTLTNREYAEIDPPSDPLFVGPT